MNWITQDWFESHECSSHHPPTDQLSNVQNSCRIGKAVYPPAFYPISWPCNKLISQWNSIGNTMKKSPKHNNSKKLLSFLPKLTSSSFGIQKWSFLPRFPRFPKHHPHLHACHNRLPCFFIRLHKEATVPRKIVTDFPPFIDSHVGWSLVDDPPYY